MFVTLAAAAGPVALVGTALRLDAGQWWFTVGPFLILTAFLLPFGTMTLECWFGATPGKRLLGLLVVGESGARISFGQSVLRQFPFFIEIWAIDVLFALFTEQKQRAFELVSKTRVVRA